MILKIFKQFLNTRVSQLDGLDQIILKSALLPIMESYLTVNLAEINTKAQLYKSFLSTYNFQFFYFSMN